MDTTNLTLVTVDELRPGSVMGSGHRVESIETGEHRWGDSIHVVMTDGTTGTVGKRNRVWVRSI